MKINRTGVKCDIKSLAEFAPRTAQINSKSVFSGGKWVRLQERKRSAARLAKSNPCSAVEFSRPGVKIMRAAGCNPLKREPSAAVLV